MAELYIVRHAPVTVDPRIPSTEWDLSTEGRAAVRHLVSDSNSWNDVKCIYHSPELKAVITASIISEMIGVPTQMMADLHELPAPAIHPTSEFIRRVGEYLEGHSDPDFEDHCHAMERIVGCVRRIARDADGHTIAMVSHGRILTVLFSYLLKRPMTVREWQSIQWPDLSVVDLDSWTVKRGFFSDLAVRNGT